jgi:hypothetical protein
MQLGFVLSVDILIQISMLTVGDVGQTDHDGHGGKWNALYLVMP